MPLIGCPDCEHSFRVGDLSPGTIITCKKCGSKLEMPDRPLRKRTRVVGSIGGRSDYIDAEDFVAGTRPRRKKDRFSIVLNNAFTVALIVGSAILAILALVGGGWLINHGWRMKAPIASKAPPSMVAADDAAPAGIGREGPALENEIDWRRFVGVWDAVEVGADGRGSRIEFTADRQMIVTRHERELDGTLGQEVPGTRMVGDVTEVRTEADLIVVHYTAPVLEAGKGASRYRFGANDELSAFLHVGTPEQREIRYRRRG